MYLKCLWGRSVNELEGTFMTRNWIYCSNTFPHPSCQLPLIHGIVQEHEIGPHICQTAAGWGKLQGYHNVILFSSSYSASLHARRCVMNTGGGRRRIFMKRNIKQVTISPFLIQAILKMCTSLACQLCLLAETRFYVLVPELFFF